MSSFIQENNGNRDIWHILENQLQWGLWLSLHQNYHSLQIWGLLRHILFDKALCYILIYQHFSNNLCRFQRKSMRRRLLTRRLCCKAWERKRLKNLAAGKAVWSREDLFLSREVKPLCMRLWPISGRSIVNNLCLLMVTSSGRWKDLEQRLVNVLEPGNENRGHRKKNKESSLLLYINNL